MGCRLQGVDMSHHQSLATFRKELKNPDTDFIILKATEGRSWVDNTFNTRAKEVLNSPKLLGAYHFARPENNSPDVEAYNFCNTVLPFRDNCLLFLDWEDKALTWKDAGARGEWIKSFMQQVKTCLGQNMMLYCSEYYIGAYMETVLSVGGGLWVARWGGQEPTMEYDLWQYTNTPYDRNYANMERKDWKVWGSCDELKETLDVVNGCDCHCGCSFCDSGELKKE